MAPIVPFQVGVVGRSRMKPTQGPNHSANRNLISLPLVKARKKPKQDHQLGVLQARKKSNPYHPQWGPTIDQIAGRDCQ